MQKPMYEKIIDLLMFRSDTENGEDGSKVPVFTTGSIVWGVILRFTIVVVISFILFDIYEMRQYWWLAFLAVWAIAAYPGYRQYTKFQEEIKRVEEDTLCGSCRHFDKTGQLCRMFDEHVSEDYIPCEGLNWEPKHFDSND